MKKPELLKHNNNNNNNNNNKNNFKTLIIRSERVAGVSTPLHTPAPAACNAMKTLHEQIGKQQRN
jgi:hypothetical protein